jgi:hypothetical protein
MVVVAQKPERICRWESAVDGMTRRQSRIAISKIEEVKRRYNLILILGSEFESLARND